MKKTKMMMMTREAGRRVQKVHGEELWQAYHR